MPTRLRVALIAIVAVVLVSVIGGGVALYLGFRAGPANPFETVTLPPSATPSDTRTASAIRSEADEDFGSVQIYSVLPDGSLDSAPSGLAATVWSTFVRVVTPAVAGRVVSEFHTGDAPESDTLAYVYEAADPTKWILAANLATSKDPTQLIATLVHEYGHLLTLGVDQVDPASDSCSTLVLDEGCAAPSSVIEAFDTSFWTAYGDRAPATGNNDSDIGYAFYQQHTEDFVSDYAATNIVEDVAESFMTFVLEDHAGGSSLAAQKVRFFEQYPTFVATRARIRGEFASDLGLAN